MRLDRPTRSIRLLQADRTSEDRLRDKRRSSRAANSTYKLQICWAKIAFWSDQLIGSTRLIKFDSVGQSLTQQTILTLFRSTQIRV